MMTLAEGIRDCAGTAHECKDGIKPAEKSSGLLKSMGGQRCTAPDPGPGKACVKGVFSIPAAPGIVAVIKKHF